MAIRSKKATMTIANAATVSAAVQIPKWASFVGVWIPAIDDGDVKLEFSYDGTNFVPVLDIDGSADVVIAASGTDPCYVDISDLCRAMPREDKDGVATEGAKIRLTCAAQASGAVTGAWYFCE